MAGFPRSPRGPAMIMPAAWRSRPG